MKATWLSLSATYSAKARASGRFLLLLATDRPCTYSGAVSSAGEGTTVGAREGVSCFRLVVRVPPPVGQAASCLLNSLELPSSLLSRTLEGRESLSKAGV